VCVAVCLLLSRGAGALPLGGDGYRLAEAGPHSPEPVDFGIVHVGDTPEQALSISNIAPADGLSESLNATVGSPTGDATTNGGSFALLPAGATNSTALAVGVDTSTAGLKSGTATITLASDGTGTSGGGTTPLPDQTVNVLAQVNNYASGGHGVYVENAQRYFEEWLEPGLVAVTALSYQHDGPPKGAIRVGNYAPADHSDTLVGDVGLQSVGADITVTGSTSFALDGGEEHLMPFEHHVTLGSSSGFAIRPSYHGENAGGYVGPDEDTWLVWFTSWVINSPAVPVIAPTLMDLGNVHVGEAAGGALTVTNDVGEEYWKAHDTLDASFAGTSGDVASATGSITGLFPLLSDSTSMSVAIDTSAPGAKSGVATVQFTSVPVLSGLTGAPIDPQDMTVTANVYAFAEATIGNAQPIDFGIVHVGDVAQQALSVTNTAPSGGFSEGLNASIGSPTGDATTNGGSFGPLAAGATDDTSLVLGIDTSTAGSKSGTASIALVSDGTGTSGLGTTALSAQSVSVVGVVNRFSNPTLTLLGGDGTLTVIDPTTYSLDLGTAAWGAPALEAQLGLVNDVLAPADELAGSWEPGAADLDLLGFLGFSGLAPGDVLDSLLCKLDTAAAGAFSATITLHPLSENASGYSGSLPDITLAVQGEITGGPDSIPEPATVLLVGVGGLAALMRRRGRRGGA